MKVNPQTLLFENISLSDAVLLEKADLNSESEEYGKVRNIFLWETDTKARLETVDSWLKKAIPRSLYLFYKEQFVLTSYAFMKSVFTSDFSDSHPADGC